MQRRIDRVRHLESPMIPQEAESFEMAKEGLRRLLAAGATDKDEAADLVSRIRRISGSGTRIDVETMIVWPNDEAKARPASEFFVNERIDLIVREAETFRNDYRSKERRVVFNALLKPLPWAKSKSSRPEVFEGSEGEIDTQKYCGFILLMFIIACGIITTLVISRQNRMTR